MQSIRRTGRKRIPNFALAFESAGDKFTVAPLGAVFPLIYASPQKRESSLSIPFCKVSHQNLAISP